jgi:hypothetical protein
MKFNSSNGLDQNHRPISKHQVHIFFIQLPGYLEPLQRIADMIDHESTHQDLEGFVAKHFSTKKEDVSP